VNRHDKKIEGPIGGKSCTEIEKQFVCERLGLPVGAEGQLTQGPNVLNLEIKYKRLFSVIFVALTCAPPAPNFGRYLHRS